MKYMILMFGDAATMVETKSPEWIEEMIGFMTQIDKDLTASGELVFQQAWPTAARPGTAGSGSASGAPAARWSTAACSCATSPSTSQRSTGARPSRGRTSGSGVCQLDRP